MNTSRTLEQLENTIWPAVPEESSPMMVRCHALRKVPLANLSAGDCRVLINQGIGEKYLVPLALGYLEGHPVLEGDYYPGDLLVAMIRVEKSFWRSCPSDLERLNRVVVLAAAEVSDASSFNPDRQLRKHIDAFLADQNA